MTRRILLTSLAALFMLAGCGPDQPAAPTEQPQESAAPASASDKVRITTSRGIIDVQLDSERAPATVANFLTYVDERFFDGTIFHRVIENFMIQGGGYTEGFQKKATHAPVKNEADNNLPNSRGTIAMARTNDPHSATAQFFINHVDNDFLNHSSKTQRGWGYTVFGKVVNGMDVVDAIATTETGAGGPFPKDVPVAPVVIESIRRIP